ncbi:MAG: phosphate ABC transporter substrate-binding protein [Bacteroidota bacterium]
MSDQKKLKDAFSTNDYGFACLPNKISGTAIARLLFGNLRGCSWCFPHGWEVDNSTVNNRQRNWKKFRKTRWKQ